MYREFVSVGDLLHSTLLGFLTALFSIRCFDASLKFSLYVCECGHPWTNKSPDLSVREVQWLRSTSFFSCFTDMKMVQKGSNFSILYWI